MNSSAPPNYAKAALSCVDQVALLQSRGLAVADTLAAAQRLACISYYRLSAYWYPFRLRDAGGRPTSQFVSGTHFDQALALYEFDRELRLLVMDAMERVEVAVRTHITQHLAMIHGPFGHENPANFHPKFDHTRWITGLREETKRSSDAFVSHFKANYTGYPALPIWMATELISMGTLSFLYKGLLSSDKHAVAKKFRLHPKRLEDWLHVLTYVRNVCAHHSRLWNREMAIRPQAMAEPEWQAPWLPRRDRIFCVLLMLRLLLAETGYGNNWRDTCHALLLPITSNDQWRLAMGMPENWRQHPFWI